MKTFTSKFCVRCGAAFCRMLYEQAYSCDCRSVPRGEIFDDPEVVTREVTPRPVPATDFERDMLARGWSVDDHDGCTWSRAPWSRAPYLKMFAERRWFPPRPNCGWVSEIVPAGPLRELGWPV